MRDFILGRVTPARPVGSALCRKLLLLFGRLDCLLWIENPREVNVSWVVIEELKRRIRTDQQLLGGQVGANEIFLQTCENDVSGQVQFFTVQYLK
jgi:hypothetical protein